jgi:hypothetical protein
MNPWDRQPDEPNLWYARFKDLFLAMPTEKRTVLGAFNIWRIARNKSAIKRQHTTWDYIVKTWHWRERAEAWDAHVREIDNKVWEARRIEWREKEFDIASGLVQKAQEMLEFALSPKTLLDGTVVKPADWRMGDAAKLADTASKLARLSAGLVTERKDTFKWETDDCTPEQIGRIANGEDPRVVLTTEHRQGASSARLAEDQTEDELA